MFKLNMFSSARKRPPRFLMSYQKRGDVGKSSLTSSEQDVQSDNTISKNKDNVKVELPTKMNVHNKKIMPMTLQFNRRPTYTGPNKKVIFFEASASDAPVSTIYSKSLLSNCAIFKVGNSVNFLLGILSY